MPPKARAPSFGSQDYWDQRFTKNTAPFDWLSAPDALDPLISEALESLDKVEPQILHIGCGSSLLSQHLKVHVQNAQQVHNIDYSKVVIDAERKRELDSASRSIDACTRWDAVDLLDYVSLLRICDTSTYSIIVDKSTSDAISCADDVVCRLPYAVTTQECTTSATVIDVELKELPVHPLYLMAVHLALVAKPGAKWIALSYNAERYPFLKGKAAETEDDGTPYTGIPDPRLMWTVVGKHQIEAKEREAGGRVTQRPKLYHWVYVLQRTSTPLFYMS
ncbi:uncharacterized protein M421DRAFT_57372 [Didymella exigua CBS 183.55]|uniref:Methyltransferase domain-containing protein n=1 Tax=Didymella exigua CBS 183.55 TaxID=1150837 RepID=A0A6A5RXD4_9PLEO|nr:uncharacterized protein M421DRAFT_57372 [Didymella exigua CBS 183.55]KAF1930956.1 hypothetical protein M421DRAFT_57372 [Didymella exigua CBS 183.55]